MNSGLSQHRIVSALLTGMHGPGQPARPVLSVVGADGVPAAPALPQARFGPRDGAARVVAAAVMDPQNRVCLTRVAAAAGWADEVPLVAECRAGEVRVSPGLRERPSQVEVRYTGGRLTLPSTARAVLQLVPAEAVIATTVPGTAQVLLVAAADLAQELTGAAAPTVAPTPVEPAAAPRRTTVRTAFRPSTAASACGD